MSPPQFCGKGGIARLMGACLYWIIILTVLYNLEEINLKLSNFSSPDFMVYIMKFLTLFLLIYIIQISLSAQTSLEKEITRIKNNPNIKLNYIGNNRVSVNYCNMKTRVYNLGRSVKQSPQFDSIPRFVFDLGQIDTSLFNYKFKFDQELPIGTTWQSPVLGDINNNGRVEYYGIKKGYYTEFS